MALSWSGVGPGAALAALLGWTLFGQPASEGLAQSTAEVKLLERDAFREVDRYQVTLRPGAALWDVAGTYLPLTGLEQGEEKAYQVVLESFQRAFPNRKPGLVQPDDAFVLEVPSGTFVTEQLTREGSSVVYRSFQGDQLTNYPRNPSLQFRLIRKDSPDKAEVGLTGQAGSAVELAREIYQVDPPDFIQVRMLRAALSDRSSRVIVDLNRKYLDEFRNFRDQAVSVKDGEDGRKIYTFGPDDRDNPFVQVEDGIGDQNDPGVFPRLFRMAFYRDGTVRGYVVTESGDTVTMFNQPDNARWQKVLPTIREWQSGVVEPLPPFAPAVNQVGSLIPGRLLVVSFAPRANQPAAPVGTRPTTAPAGSGLNCLGMPLALIFLGLGGWGLRRFHP